MNKLYGKLKMTWAKVILFAVAAGVYTGLVMMVPGFKNTSFQDIGISYEWWVIFAVIVVVNCKKSTEAMLKCFVFFLVSQPLVYAVEVLGGTLALNMGIYYYKTIWFKMTLLTLPGGFIAYFCKKQNVWGSIILGLGNTIQLSLGVVYFLAAVKDFPHHLLSSLTCVASVFVMTFGIQKHAKYRRIAIIVPVLLTTALIVFMKVNGLSMDI